MFDCLDCKIDTSDTNEYYMVHDEVWYQAGLRKSDGMLCIGCLEARLQRRLTSADFTAAPVNHGFFKRSDRLLRRVYSDLLQKRTDSVCS